MDMWGWIIGVIVGVSVGMYMQRTYTKKRKESAADIASIEHAQNIEKAIAYTHGLTEITNDELQKHLGVSDTTTQRYLNELEKQGILKQHGIIGRGVKYDVL